MQKKNTLLRFLTTSLALICAFCIVIFFVMARFINGQNEKVIDKVGNIYMSGMNERITMHFDTMVTLRMSQLENLVKTIPDWLSSDREEMQEWLEYSAKARDFDALSFYCEDGTIETVYGDTITPVSADSFHQYMEIGEKRIAAGTDSQGNRCVLLGIPVNAEIEKGKKCIALLGSLPVDYISESLSLGEDDTLVYSYVIRRDGSFVIRTADVVRENYFDRISALYEVVNGKGSDQLIGELVTAMEAGEDYSELVQVYGERRQLYCSRLPMSEWYLVTVMPYGPLNEEVEALGTRTFLISMGGCLLVLLALLFVFWRYLEMSRAQMRELDEARRMAEEASKSKSEFLSNMSHDIRTPMNAIVGMTSIAMANISDSKRVQDCLRKIALSSRHLLGLINDVLDMSKIESGKMTLNVELVSLREIMDSMISIVQPQIKAKNQRFNVLIYDISSENVRCDSVRLNQVILNLLSNAIKFTPENGFIEVSLHEEESPKGPEFVRIRIRVKDDGIGMSEEFKEHIFDSFSREDRKRVQKTEGTGLGMAITKYIVDAMGGQITVDSTQGFGTEFNVTLDMEKAEESEETMLLPDFTMLVVDDDKQLCDSTVASLRSIGVHAESALDGESAIDMVTRHHQNHDDYHIILLDWKLPGMDGLKTARELRRQLGDDVPILLISAYDCSEIEEEARDAGINGFLSKPLFKSTLYYGLKPYTDGTEEPAKAEKKKNVDYEGRRILLAEDSDLNWEIANELLSDMGLTLDWAENGQICVDMFKNSPVGYYDAILMDIRMPVMNGYEATDAIRALDRTDASLPIIAMTADAFSEDIKRCLDHGMNAHLAKPIDIKEVMRILDRYFKRA